MNAPSRDPAGLDPQVPPRARIVLRPLGSSLPLGFLALAGASVFLSGLQLGWVATTEQHQVALAVAVFAVPLGLLAAVFGFLARDSVGGAGNGLLAGCWLVVSALSYTSPPGSTSPLLGLVACFAAAALLIPVVAAALGKVVAAVAVAAAAARFALTGIYELTANTTVKDVSGWWGVGVCVVGLYAALAFQLEDTRRRPVLPVLRHGPGLQAVTGDTADELERVQHEAGVREQL